MTETPIIVGFIDNENKSKKELETRAPKIVIKETTEKKDDNGKAAIYMINYTVDDKERFAIVSGDKREIPILAFGPEFQNFYDIPDGLKQWLQNKLNKINFIRKENKPDQEEDIKKAWAKLDLLPLGVIPPPPPPGCGTYVTYTVGPLTQTRWQQSCYFFNHFVTGTGIVTCPVACVQTKAKLGCVAIAVAQIAKRYNFGRFPNGTIYNWASMLNSNGSTSEVGNSKMLFDIAKDGLTLFGCTYSASNSTKALYSLHNLGYSNAIKCLWTGGSEVKTQLDMGRPVYCAGQLNQFAGGHAWVIDGYTSYGDNCSTTYYYRCNWGYEEAQFNGNYAYNNFNPGGDNFSDINDIIINIYR